MNDKYKSGVCFTWDGHIRSGGQDIELRVSKATYPSTYLESVKLGEQYKRAVKFCGVRHC